MTDEAGSNPGRRFLHVCYNCSDADAATDFFVDALNMRATMRTPMEYTPGELLGMNDREIEACASFVFDQRGPRVSPAIEIQGWGDPEAIGVPSIDPFEVGVKALGYGVPDLDAAQARLVQFGCTVVFRGSCYFADDWLLVLDPMGMPIELAQNSAVAEGSSQLRHLRITCADLDESLAFYGALGFQVIESGSLNDASFVGHAGDIDARFARVRLPDEPFEIMVIHWLEPASHSRHYAEPYHRGIYRLALGVDDTRLSKSVLEARGFVFDRHARLVELKGTPVPDMWITFISDPNGIPFEFVQRPRDAFR